MFISVHRGKFDYTRYECDEYSVRFRGVESNPYEEEFVELQLELRNSDSVGNQVSTKIVNVSSETDTVFVMNESGETIDRIIKKKS